MSDIGILSTALERSNEAAVHSVVRLCEIGGWDLLRSLITSHLSYHHGEALCASPFLSAGSGIGIAHIHSAHKDEVIVELAVPANRVVSGGHGGSAYPEPDEVLVVGKIMPSEITAVYDSLPEWASS